MKYFVISVYGSERFSDMLRQRHILTFSRFNLKEKLKQSFNIKLADRWVPATIVDGRASHTTIRAKNNPDVDCIIVQVANNVVRVMEFIRKETRVSSTLELTLYHY